ncbi:MAG: hypothetical protein R8K50_02840, partial [Mariprofundus sp.]
FCVRLYRYLNTPDTRKQADMTINNISLSTLVYGFVFIVVPLMLIFFDTRHREVARAKGSRRRHLKVMLVIIVVAFAAMLAPDFNQSDLDLASEKILSAKQSFEDFMNDHFATYVSNILKSDIAESIKRIFDPIQ